MPEGTSPVYGSGLLSLDVTDRSLKRDGVPVPLTPKLFDLLVALVEGAGRLVEKETLLKKVQPDVAEEGNLTKGVFSPRQCSTSKIRLATSRPFQNGYWFVAGYRRRAYPLALVRGVSPGISLRIQSR